VNHPNPRLRFDAMATLEEITYEARPTPRPGGQGK
jgi:hypothetical protein